MDRLLAAGGGLSAYRSNPSWPVGPREGSWAWKLERLAEDQFKVKHAIAVSSGTMALMAAIKALRLPKGGEIITSPYTFSATAAAAMFMGYTPVFADVTGSDYTLDPMSVARAVTPETVALMPVDLFGGLADYAEFQRSGLPIIQDACQAVGATRFWLYGQIAAWSFNGAKNVPAGEAGMVLTNHENLARRARLFISHGENWGSGINEDGEIGINGRLNEVTACVAYFGMKDLPKNNERRRELAGELWRYLKDREDIYILGPDRIAHHALYVYPIQLTDRARINRPEFIRRMKRMGIEVGGGYITPPLHQYRALPLSRFPLNKVTELSERTLCLLSQVRPPATRADMRYLADCIEAALDGTIGPRLRKMGFLADTIF